MSLQRESPVSLLCFERAPRQAPSTFGGHLMAATSRAEATWEGDLMKGSGTVKPASGSFGTLPISWAARSERAAGETKTSPEELIAAAHAGCYSMAFSNGLAKAGHQAERLDTTAAVDF